MLTRCQKAISVLAGNIQQTRQIRIEIPPANTDSLLLKN
jgi:hypothetical protein